MSHLIQTTFSFTRTYTQYPYYHVIRIKLYCTTVECHDPAYGTFSHIVWLVVAPGSLALLWEPVVVIGGREWVGGGGGGGGWWLGGGGVGGGEH